MISVLVLLFLLLSFYYAWFLMRIYSGLKNVVKQNARNSDTNGSFVTVLIPFRNESENILNSLRCVTQQSYPAGKYEVIYVNDSSTDDSLEKIMNASKPENVRVLSVPEGFHTSAHKKRAIRFGLEHARGEIIVSTDCDCLMGKEWLKSILECFDENTAFVSAPVDFIDHSTLSGRLQRLEFAGLILAGAGLIGAGTPTICNAANLAYRKRVFYEVGGFDDNIQLSSGDDEIFMQKIAANTSYDIRYCMNTESVVTTWPSNSLDHFYQQRKRWASKGLFYLDKLLVLKLFFIFLFYLSIPVQLLLAVFYSGTFFATLALSLLVKFAVEFMIMNMGRKYLFGKGLLRYFPLAELLHIPYIIIAGISGAFGNFRWKERELKR